MTTITITIPENVDADKLKYLLQTYRSISSLVSEDIKVSSRETIGDVILFGEENECVSLGAWLWGLPSQEEYNSLVGPMYSLYDEQELYENCLKRGYEVFKKNFNYYKYAWPRMTLKQREEYRHSETEFLTDKANNAAWGSYYCSKEYQKKQKEREEKQKAELESGEIDDKLKAELELFDAVFGYD